MTYEQSYQLALKLARSGALPDARQPGYAAKLAQKAKQ